MKTQLKSKKIIPDATYDKIAGMIIDKQKLALAADAILRDGMISPEIRYCCSVLFSRQFSKSLSD